MDSTLLALQKHGLPPISYDLIAAETGLSRQLVRYHYPDADDLMVAVCDRLAAVYRQLLVTNAARLEGPGRLEMFLDFYFDLLDGTPKPRDDRVYDAMMSLSASSGAVRENLRGQYKLLGQVISHEINTAHPEMPARATEELAYIFVCLMYGHWKMVASLGVSDAHKKVSRAAMDRLIRSYVDGGKPLDDVGQIWGVGT
ncbi:TetR/AcrR family transcriptional regulator [Antarctobacter jejuensis]|uniref:TetR/AcrR family transcriptional regulator n=1 Tax=Antarctobacter jejuensis TaxID=1439938 RepID=UPI003FD424CA